MSDKIAEIKAQHETKFRKKPIVIEAVRYTSGFLWPDWFRDAVSQNVVVVHGTGKFANTETCFAKIKTLEGVMRANEGDWIIRGVNGELYPCKPDIFAATYEPVEEVLVHHSDVLAAHSGQSAGREWHNVGEWLYPGDKIVLTSEPLPPVKALEGAP